MRTNDDSDARPLARPCANCALDVLLGRTTDGGRAVDGDCRVVFVDERKPGAASESVGN